MKKLIFLFVWLGLNIPSVLLAQNPYWITATEDQSATNTWLGFIKEVSLTQVPEELNARIAVDSKYWLWINGHQVVFEGAVKRGPNPNDTYYDLVNIAPYLQEGNNTISILLWYFGKQGFSYNPSGKAALFFDAQSDYVSIVSDQSWKSFVHPAFYTPMGEVPNFRLSESNIGYDARKAVDYTDWYTGKSNLQFAKAKVVGREGDAPWNKLHYRLIPQWKNYGLQNYLSVEKRMGSLNDTLVCALPYNCHVTPYFKVNAKAGEVISIQTDHYYGGGAPNVRAEYITKNGQQAYESLGWMSGHKVIYILPKEVRLEEVKYRETSYDSEFVGSFTCDDELLNQLWVKAQRTLMVTMRDTYMDCPDRERSQWWGDAVNESGETFYALSPSSHLLTKKGMYELIGWQGKDGSLHSPIPSSNWDMELPGQMLASIGFYGFWNYYLHTGDLQTLKDLYPGVRRYLAAWQKNSDGTVQTRQTAWVWGDWGTNIDKEAIFNAWYYIALKGALEMAKALHYEQDVQTIASEMNEFKPAFNSKFWNGKSYRTPSYTEDTDDRVHALAVVGGLAEKKMYPAILKVFKSQEYASPYMEKYVDEALILMGESAYAFTRMKKRFQPMVENSKCTTLYEGWGIGNEGFGGGSSNHAWSGGGLTLMSQYVCGIAPVKPGYELFSVMPTLVNFKHASATMECVRGKISVAWKNEKKLFSMDVFVPQTTHSVIGIPVKQVRYISCNGDIIWRKHNAATQNDPRFHGIKNGYVTFLMDSGKYHFIANK